MTCVQKLSVRCSYGTKNIKMYKSNLVQRRMVLVVNFIVFLKLLLFLFCFVVVILDLEHDVKAIFHLP